MGFSIYAWITIVTVLATFGVLLFTKLRSDLVFLCVIGVLFITGVLDASEALSGFSSTTVAVVGVMFVVVAGSSLINTKIGNGSFERDNNVTLVAVARRGKRIEQAPREVVLQAGDTPS